MITYEKTDIPKGAAEDASMRTPKRITTGRACFHSKEKASAATATTMKSILSDSEGKSANQVEETTTEKTPKKHMRRKKRIVATKAPQGAALVISVFDRTTRTSRSSAISSKGTTFASRKTP